MPTTNRDGVTLEYAVQGTGPVVVLVPDACLGPWMWAWVVDELAGAYTVVTTAPRGCAKSDAGAASAYSVGELCDDLEAVLAAIDAARVHLVGSGFGGQICLDYAATYGRCRSLTLVGTGTRPAFDAGVIDQLCDPMLESVLELYLDDLQTALPTDQLQAWSGTDDPSPTVCRQQLNAATEYNPPSLYEITVPSRVLHGEGDRVWSVPGGETLATELPNATFDVVVDAPHLLPVATPTLVADEIAGLVDGTSTD